jgi:HTH-type transcriptional regulator, glycine betaine synthesis regulator
MKKSAQNPFFGDESETTLIPNDLEFGPGNEAAMAHTCEAIGRIIETWGFKKIMGMMWGFLYLCPEPACAKDICKALSISPALVSITIQELLQWGVVRKLSPIGKRRDYYIAEHIWKMVRKVLNERGKREMEWIQEKLETALDVLETEKNSSPQLKSKRTCQFQKIRIEDLLGATHTAQNILNLFMELGKVDVSPIQQALKPYTTLTEGLKSAVDQCPRTNVNKPVTAV